MSRPTVTPLRHTYVSNGFEFVWMKGRATIYVRKLDHENFFYGFKPITVSGQTPAFAVMPFHRAIIDHNREVAETASRELNERVGKGSAGRYILRWHQVLDHMAREVYGASRVAK